MGMTDEPRLFTHFGPTGILLPADVARENQVAINTRAIGKTPIEFPDEGAESGSTDHFTGTVGTTKENVPSTDAGSISQILIECPLSSPGSLKVSFNNGVGIKTLEPGSNIVWSPRGGLKHLELTGSVAGVKYDIVMNRNDV